MLNKLFTSKTRVELLSLLLFNDDRDYHLRKIAKVINAHPSIVSIELENLLTIGIVTKKKKANLLLYSIDKKCVFLNDLKNIFIKTDYFGTLIKKELTANVKYCLIYGSFAKGTENSNSDIDLLIVSEMKEDIVLKIIQKIEDSTNREINFVLWNEKTFKTKAKDNHLLKTINQSNIIMLMGDENEFRHQIQ